MDEHSGWRNDVGIASTDDDLVEPYRPSPGAAGMGAMRARTGGDPISEEMIVALLRAGSRSAVGVLYDRYAAALHGVIVRIVRSEEIAEDILQETFIKIWTNFASYDESKGRLFTWMMRIARNMALDKVKSREYRDARKNHELDSLVTQVDNETSISYDPDQLGLMEIVHSSLTPEYERLVRLIYVQGYTQAEAARELGIPLGTVKTRLRAAITIIRKIFS
jgi:RNA polymerase sigma-70 factor (ECF subfamily)